MTKYNILQTMTPSFVFFQMITCYFHSLSCLANDCVACPAMKWLNTSESLTFAARGWLKLWYKTGSGSQRGLPGDLQAEVTLCWKLESPRVTFLTVTSHKKSTKVPLACLSVVLGDWLFFSHSTFISSCLISTYFLQGRGNVRDAEHTICVAHTLKNITLHALLRP